jgi:lysophospholipase L1-like esterase
MPDSRPNYRRGVTKLMFRTAGAAILLGVFGCSNARLPDPNVRYVAFGDSMTAGPTEVDYPDVLAELIGEPANAFSNEGSGGETTAAGLDRLNGLISDGIFPNAHTLIYWQGGADLIAMLREVDPFLLLSPQAPGYPFSERLAQMLEQVQVNNESAILAGRAAGWNVVVATYPFRPRIPLACEALPIPVMVPEQVVIANAYTRMLNERIRQAAANTGALLVDVEAEERLSRNPLAFVDCNHLSESGNRVVAELFLAVLAGD